jgi:hypothetical protein
MGAGSCSQQVDPSFFILVLLCFYQNAMCTTVLRALQIVPLLLSFFSNGYQKASPPECANVGTRIGHHPPLEEGCETACGQNCSGSGPPQNDYTQGSQTRLH